MHTTHTPYLAWTLSLWIMVSALTLHAAEPRADHFFVENKGQIRYPDGSVAEDVLYSFKDGNVTVFIFRDGISYQFTAPGTQPNKRPNDLGPLHKEQEETALMPSKGVHRFEVRFTGTNTQARVTAQQAGEAYSNFYLSNTIQITGARSFSSITVEDIYPGIDWMIYFNDGGLKYDLIVHPGADPAKIDMLVNGANKIRQMSAQMLVYTTRLGEVTDSGLFAYQVDHDHDVDAEFVRKGNHIGFDLAEYDKTTTLVIDPALDWSSFYGGTGEDAINGMNIDADSNLVFTGYTASANAIAYLGYQNTYVGGTYDAYIVKMNGSGERIWSTYYGGTKGDFGTSVASNENKDLFISGFSFSTNLPTTVGAYQPARAGDYDGFLVKLDASGALVFATYFGGIGAEFARSVVVDHDHNIYISGSTTSASGIASGGWQMTFGGSNDEFLAKFSDAGGLLWSTYFGGPGEDYSRNVNVDGNNDVFLVGYSNSSTGIAYNAFDSTWQSNYDCTLAKYTSSGTLQWATYYGGNGDDNGNAVAFDADNNAYLAIQTGTGTGLGFNGFQMNNGGGMDAMLAKFSPGGNRIWATYYGGFWEDMAKAVQVEGTAVYVVGHSMSAGLGLYGYENMHSGYRDGLLCRFDTAGALTWATYAGGFFDEYGRALAVLDAYTLYWGGKTFSHDYPSTYASYQMAYGGGIADGFFQKVSDCPVLNTYYADDDGDGYGDASATFMACVPPTGGVADSTDCDDDDPAVFPTAMEICNTVDDDCDGLVDDADIAVGGQTSWYADMDADLYGDPTTEVLACVAPMGFVATGMDCNDTDAFVYPGAAEICNLMDDDCDGFADEDVVFTTYYFDADGDGFGTADSMLTTCDGIPVGFVVMAADCNDANNLIHPSAAEVCNTLDDDCDALIDDGVVSAMATAMGPTTFCKGSSVTLQANSGAGYSYQWKKNGIVIAGATGFTYMATQTGNYTVTTTVAGGCSAVSAAVSVTVNSKPNPVITVVGDLNICATGTVQLRVKNKAGDTYQWYKDGVVIAGATTNVYIATAIGSYYARQTSPAGCFKNSAPVSVTSSCRSEADQEWDWTVTPNPATTYIDIAISSDGTNSVHSVQIMNMLGEHIAHSDLNPTQSGEVIRLQLPEGIADGPYVVILFTPSGQYSRQFIVSR